MKVRGALQKLLLRSVLQSVKRLTKYVLF